MSSNPGGSGTFGKMSLLPTQDPSFPMLVAQQEDPASRSLAFTVSLLNGGLLLGWVVGIATGGMTAADILGGLFALIIFSLLMSLGWYTFLRTRYGLGFYLLGTEPGNRDGSVSKFGSISNFVNKKWILLKSNKFISQRFESKRFESKVTPAIADPSIVRAVHSMDESELHVAMDGPSEEVLVAAENEIRKAMEDGAPNDIFMALESHSSLISFLGPDLVWAAEVLQMRLQTAITALERAKEMGPISFEEGARLDDVQVDAKATYGDQRPQSRDPVLSQLAETTALLLAEEEAEEGTGRERSSKEEAERRELLAQLESMKEAVESLQAYKLVQAEELFIVTRRNLKHKLELGDMKQQMEAAEVTAAASQKERMDLIMEMQDRTLLAAALKQRVLSVSSEKLIKRVADLHDATKLCNNIIHHIEQTLDVTAYSSRSPAFKSGEGSKGETPKVSLTLFATGPSMRPLLHTALERDQACFTYEVLSTRATMHITNVQHNARVHWFRPQAQGSGHLLLIPLAASAVGGTLGVLTVDTINKANRQDIDFIPEEIAALELAAMQMAKALLQARSLQSEAQSQMLEAINMEPEGWAGLMMQRMELLRMKQRLDSVLADGTPEMRACLSEIKTYKKPSRAVIAVGSAMLMLLKSQHTEKQYMERFQRVGLPSFPDVLEAFWKEYVQPELMNIGDKLMSSLQAVNFRHQTDKRPYQHTAAILDSVSPYFGGSGILAYIFPWMKCLLALEKVVLPSEPQKVYSPGLVDVGSENLSKSGGLSKSDNRGSDGGLFAKLIPFIHDDIDDQDGQEVM